MAWSNSKVFVYFLNDALANANNAAFDLSGAAVNTFRAALYKSTITPDNTVAATGTCYNSAGTWASGNQTADNADGWLTVGEPLVSPALTVATATLKWDANDTASTTSTVDLTDATGVLVYNDTLTTPADPGICFNYFGGSNSVVSGTFTIVWSTSGIFTIAC